MTDNILKFPGKDQWSPSPARLIEFLVKNADRLESLAFIGLSREGEEISGFACTDAADVFFHMELLKKRLLDSYSEAE